MNMTSGVILLACILGGGHVWQIPAARRVPVGSLPGTLRFNHFCGLDLKSCLLCSWLCEAWDQLWGLWPSHTPSPCTSRFCRHIVSFWRNFWRMRKHKSMASVSLRTLRASPCNRRRDSAPRISRRWWTCSRWDLGICPVGTFHRWFPSFHDTGRDPRSWQSSVIQSSDNSHLNSQQPSHLHGDWVC